MKQKKYTPSYRFYNCGCADVLKLEENMGIISKQIFPSIPIMRKRSHTKGHAYRPNPLINEYRVKVWVLGFHL